MTLEIVKPEPEIIEEAASPVPKFRRTTESRSLQVFLTDSEKLDLGKSCGDQRDKIRKLESEAEDHKNKAKHLKEDADSQTRQLFADLKILADGYDYRQVKVEKLVDYEDGRVSFTRQDTGEVIESRPIRPEEAQQKMEFGA